MTQRSPGEFSSRSPILLLPVGTLDIFVWGGGGVSGDRIFVRLVFFFFDFRISAVVYFYLCILVYIST